MRLFASGQGQILGQNKICKFLDIVASIFCTAVVNNAVVKVTDLTGIDYRFTQKTFHNDFIADNLVVVAAVLFQCKHSSLNSTKFTGTIVSVD